MCSDQEAKVICLTNIATVLHRNTNVNPAGGAVFYLRHYTDDSQNVT